MKEGTASYQLAKELFPICRSITGEGTRMTLRRLKQEMPIMSIHEVPTGTAVLDWTVPKEWVIRSAYIDHESGRRILDFNASNLHVVGYSAPIDKKVTLAELQNYLYSLPDQPDWIPYVTSYYQERSGFCIAHRERENLPEGTYHIHIDSELKPGSLTYGEILLPGESDQEIFLSTYVCHPSMANNELSGPCVQIELAKWLSSLVRRRYTYRLIFIPETIGAVTYLSRHLDTLKRSVIAGFNLSCVGDDRVYSYLASRYGDTLADRVAINTLDHLHPGYISYSYLKRGSDERQYNAPGVDLPVCSVMRSKFGEYPEYHTSADNLDLISPAGLQGSFDVYQAMILAFENNDRYQVTCLGEPQLGKRGLYPTESYKGSADHVTTMMDLIAYCDGNNDLIEISNIIGKPISELIPISEKLVNQGLLIRNQERRKQNE